MSGNKDKNPEQRKTEEIPADVSPLDLSIEREKLKLDQERLAIERDRLEAQLEELDARTANAPNPDDLTFGITAICVVASVCLLLGGIIGFTSGLDIGRRQSPEPRKLLVSRSFVELMKSVNGFKPETTPEPEPPLWIPPQNPELRETLIISR